MNDLELDWMLTIDETGMPKAPTLKQLLDRDVSLLYTRDKSPNKEMYVKEVGVIYYLGDPKGPCLQEGLSEKEALKKAIENFDLPKNYQPDVLVWKLIKRYYNQKAGAGMEAVGENAPKGAGKKKNTKARMDKAEEEAINAAKAAAFLKEDEEA